MIDEDIDIFPYLLFVLLLRHISLCIDRGYINHL